LLSKEDNIDGLALLGIVLIFYSFAVLAIAVKKPPNNLGNEKNSNVY